MSVIRRWRRRRPANPATLAASAAVLADIRALVAEEARLRQELGLRPGPTFHEAMAMTPDQLTLEGTRLRMELGLPAEDDGPGGAS